MSTWSVWTFDTPDGAEKGLRVLERSQTLGRLVIADSAIVEWSPGRTRPDAYQVGSMSSTSMLAGAFWGLVFSVLYLLPLTGFTAGTTWAADGLGRIGLPEPVLREIRGRTVQGTSSLFLLTDDGEVEQVRAVLGGARAAAAPSSPGLVSILTAAEDSALRHAFGDNA